MLPKEGVPFPFNARRYGKGWIKRYFKIDQRHFVYYVECLSSPPPFQVKGL